MPEHSSHDRNNSDWDEREQVLEITDSAHAGGSLAFQRDKWFYRSIAICLGLTLVGCVGGIILLSNQGSEIPDSLTAIGSAAIGVFAGVLVDTRRQ